MREREVLATLDGKSIDGTAASLLVYRLDGDIEVVATESQGGDAAVVLSAEQAVQLARTLTAVLCSQSTDHPAPGSVSAGATDVHTRRFEFVVGSDLKRDGMFIECRDLSGDRDVLEAFFSDATGSFTTFWSAGGELPFEVVERFVRVARERLPPMRPVDGESRSGASS